ncbi:MAG: hypothetical protein LAN84_12730 [Acidobacteriia bacterium]|nr:hypothetical protein [Terriglobia bacterium]
MTDGYTQPAFSLLTRGALLCCALAGFIGLGASARAQDARPGPLPPPPEERSVRRAGTTPAAEAPPALPPEEILKRVAQKEEQFLEARTHFWNRKTIRVQEFGEDGKPSGQLEITTEPAVTSDGKPYDRVVGQPESTLRSLRLAPEDLEALAYIPAYPLTTRQLAKYDVKYMGKEQVDEISCYVFQAKPKSVERAHAYFDGVVWVDDKYFEVVKTYGKWVTDLGDVHSPTLPFTLFETYRENVEGKYWFPSYARSDDTLHFSSGDVAIRLIVKWTEYKALPGVAPAAGPAVAPPAPVKKP